MPWTLRFARAVGIVLALSWEAGLATSPSQAQSKPGGRRPAVAVEEGDESEMTDRAKPARGDDSPVGKKPAKVADDPPTDRHARGKGTKVEPPPDAKANPADVNDEKGKKDGPPKENPAVARLREMLGGGMNTGQSASPAAILLPVPSVQKELKLDAKQTAKVLEVNAAIDARRRQLFREARADGLFEPESMVAITAELQQESEASISRVLTPAQRKRLEQIAMQIMGPLAISSPGVAAKLHLTESQQAAVEQILEDRKMINEEIRNARRDMFMASRNPDPGDRATRDLMVSEANRTIQKSEKYADQSLKKLTQLLNKKQKAALEAKMGEPFDLSKLEGGAGGRGGRNGWPGGPGGPGGGNLNGPEGPIDPADAPRRGDRGGNKPASKAKATQDKAEMDDTSDEEMPAKPAKPKVNSRRPARPASDEN